LGTWSTRRLKDGLEVVVEPFEALQPEVAPGLETEVKDVGRFLGMQGTLRTANC
jgi:hypothetical protein